MVSEHASPLAALGGVDAGGQNVHVAELSRALAAMGHQVTVYTRRDAPDQRERVRLGPGVSVEHVPAGPARPVPKDKLLPYMSEFGRHLARKWRARPPDVAHGHFWMSGLAALAGARDLGVPVAQTFHALGVVKRRHQGRKDPSPRHRIKLEALIGRGVDAVLATCSDELFELIRLGVPRRAITIVPCGVNTAKFSPDGPTAARGRRPRLLSLGRLVERKGVATTVQALAAIPDAELVVAGGPPPEELDRDPQVRRLRQIAAACRVDHRVTFLGRVARPDVPKLIRSADLVVSVPWYEPFGIVPVEAMACGVPVVASAVGGHIDTVVDGTTGVLVPPRRPDVLARQVRELLADPTRRAAFGIAGADRANARFTWARVATETFRVYERLAQPERMAAAGGARR